MENPSRFLAPQTFRTYIENLFGLQKFTWATSVILTSLVFFPLSILLYFAMNSFYTELIGILGNISDFSTLGDPSKFFDLFSQLLKPILLFIPLGILFAIGSVFVNSAVTVAAFLGCREQVLSFQEATKIIFTKYFAKLFIFSLLAGLILFGFILVPCLVLGILTGIFIALNLASLGIMIFFLGYFALIIFLLIFTYILSLGFPIMVNEDLGPAKAVTRSFKLAKNNWWRILGIFFVISMIVSFSLSMLTGPLISGTMYTEAATQMFRSMVDNSGLPDFQSLIHLFKAMTGILIPLTFSQFLAILAESMLMPALGVLVYVDMRERKFDRIQGNYYSGPEGTGSIVNPGSPSDSLDSFEGSDSNGSKGKTNDGSGEGL